MTSADKSYFDASEGGTLDIHPDIQKEVDDALSMLLKDNQFKSMVEGFNFIKEEFEVKKMIPHIKKARERLKEYIEGRIPPSDLYAPLTAAYLARKCIPYSIVITGEGVFQRIRAHLKLKGYKIESE